MNNYLNLSVTLDDGTVVNLSIRKYLNASYIFAKTAEERKKASTRAKAAWAAWGKLSQAIVADLNKRKGKKVWTLPAWIDIADYTFTPKGLARPFIGKGSPWEIYDVLWLASRYGLINAGSAQKYCDTNLGTDCNGFVGNFWGIDPENPPKYYDLNPRKKLNDILVGDAIVTFNAKKAKGEHIAVVSEIADRRGNDLTLKIIESGGPENGVHESAEFAVWKLEPDGKGALRYVTQRTSEGVTKARYICGGPAKNDPRTW